MLELIQKSSSEAKFGILTPEPGKSATANSLKTTSSQGQQRDQEPVSMLGPTPTPLQQRVARSDLVRGLSRSAAGDANR
ncbi:hypothetical protein F2P81_015904 [Scophthalmus maximus]|uniref:Uncharacterized protein n=1 Tax=Scophthalmus maximus TaxID=52904 RepID=A0A6A4SFT3_SCOMX|nr:hypothetical protein F2P81_015904 [Scophthalmus maximus]